MATSRRYDQHLQREFCGGKRVGRPHLLQRRGYLAIWQRPLVTDAVLRQCRANGIACRIILTVSPRDRPLHQDPDPLPYAPCHLPLLVPEIVGEQRPHYIGCGDLVDPLASRAGRFTWRDYKILRIFITGWRRIFRLIWTSKGAIPFISSWSFKSSPPPS